MDWARFAQQMATMARDLLAQESLAATLERITRSATELVDGCDAAGVLVLHDRAVETLAPTHQLVTESDKLQQQLGEGPYYDAVRSSQGERVFRIADLTGEHQRWPAYAPQARELGVGSMMGFLLFTEDEDFGALNLYSRKPGAFTEVSELAGWPLASHARSPSPAPAPTPRWNRPSPPATPSAKPWASSWAAATSPRKRRSTSCAAPHRKTTSSSERSPVGSANEAASRDLERTASPARRLNQRSLGGASPMGTPLNPAYTPSPRPHHPHTSPRPKSRSARGCLRTHPHGRLDHGAGRGPVVELIMEGR